MKITINTNIFAAVSLFRGIDDIRYYLNGLYLETEANGARLVGCDGHQLAVTKIDGEFPAASIIIPSSLADTVKPKAKAPKFITLEFPEGNQRFEGIEDVKGVFVPRDITLTFGETTTTAKEVEGRFPDYRRVVPAEVDNTIAQYEPRLVNRIDKACNILGYKFFVGIAHNGESSGLSVIEDGFVVVTMPFKATPNTTSPKWVQESICEQTPVLLAA